MFILCSDMLNLSCAVERCADDNMSTCSVDEADFQPLQDQLVTLDAADSDAESIDSEQENALKYAYLSHSPMTSVLLVNVHCCHIELFPYLNDRFRLWSNKLSLS